MSYRIVILPGDGIGPEVITEGVKVLEKIARSYELELSLEYGLIGGAACDAVGSPLPEKTLELCDDADAILMGAIGGPQWDHLISTSRPEAGLLGLRSHLGLYANLRPARVSPSLVNASPLKTERVVGVDLLIVRELTGGIYYGTPRGIIDDGRQRVGINTEIYRASEIERIARVAFEQARARRGKVTSVDKANVLESSQLWREVVCDISRDYPEVTLDHLYVDNCAMQLVTEPQQFDVVLTSNLFGDILSDEAAVITGSIGMLPSASIGSSVALYEPVHGSAPELAGKGLANPLATILSVAMLLDHSLKMPLQARKLEAAVEDVLEAGFRTADIASAEQTAAHTARMGDLVAERIREKCEV